METKSGQLAISELTVAEQLIGVAGVVAAGAIGWLHRDSALTAAGLVVIVTVATWLAIVDLRHHLLPNRFVGPLAAGVAAWLVLIGLPDNVGQTMAAFGYGFGALAIFFVMHLVAGLGMGDVKFACPLGATLGWFGWDTASTALLVLCFSAALAVIAPLARSKGMKHRLAYGPFMTAGLVAGLLQAGVAL